MEMKNPIAPKERQEYRLAEKLRSLRAYRGMTQKQVAQVAGIDESTVRNYELARRTPKREHIDGLAKALEVMPEALMQFDDHASPAELFRMLWEIADHYGFEFGYGDDFAYMAPASDFFIVALKRWLYAYDEMCKNEDAFRDSYELWKGEFHDHFEKSDYPDIYPDYDPLDDDAAQRWMGEKFSDALKDARRFAGLTQEQLADESGISMFTLRSYEQGKRMPRKKQKEALCEALGLSDAGLEFHYFGSPNQAMHYLFAIAKASNLTPVGDEELGPILRTNGNWAEWAFVQLSDELERLGENASPVKQDEFNHWVAEFDPFSEEETTWARKVGRLRADVRAELPPKA